MSCKISAVKKDQFGVRMEVFRLDNVGIKTFARSMYMSNDKMCFLCVESLKCPKFLWFGNNITAYIQVNALYWVQLQGKKTT